MLDDAVERFGPTSEPALLLERHLQDLAQEAPPEIGGDAPREIDLSEGLMKSPVLMVGLGIAVVAALMGFSTLFIGMLAVKWLAL